MRSEPVKERFAVKMNNRVNATKLCPKDTCTMLLYTCNKSQYIRQDDSQKRLDKSKRGKGAALSKQQAGDSTGWYISLNKVGHSKDRLHEKKTTVYKMPNWP
ncbi:hypothetical protein CHS0354_032477 [Potamilus streckersoni]|uniref:Uncharacterized protein n=1 Tax=Potamilus streckersoni TaxID=2493646 RepID=A0AAE0VZ18_9BIVA|nr:hypothetical protein CHS0354_032477 [Potamilus streckersoni]